MIRKTLNQTIAQIREMQRVTGPAITLLFVCLVLVGLASIARASPTEQVFNPPVDVEARAPAEVVTWIDNLDGPPVLIVNVDAAEADRYSVYLPGLEMKRTRLRYDVEVAQHTGVVNLPANAPTTGHFTLRLVDQAGRTWDFAVQAEAPEPGC